MEDGCINYSKISVVWGIILGALYYGWRRHARDAVIVGALVPSHWVLDLLVHRPDLPVWPGGPEVGFGLWNSVPGTLLVEFGLFGVGLALYLAATTPRIELPRGERMASPSCWWSSI